jgi:hypothetical protein
MIGSYSTSVLFAFGDTVGKAGKPGVVLVEGGHVALGRVSAGKITIPSQNGCYFSQFHHKVTWPGLPVFFQR